MAIHQFSLNGSYCDQNLINIFETFSDLSVVGLFGKHSKVKDFFAKIGGCNWPNRRILGMSTAQAWEKFAHRK